MIIAGIGIGLALSELAVRIALPSYTSIVKLNRFAESERGKFTEYDKELGWSGLKNTNDDFVWVDTHHHVSHNGYGYRGSEYPFQRTSKKRLLFLGDSFVWGFGVENKEIFTSVMEAKLNNSTEIVNTGVSGYGNDQEYLLWQKKGHQWSPDHVILMITVFTDYWDNMSPIRYGYPKPVFWLGTDGKLKLLNVPVPKIDTSLKNQKQETISHQSKLVENILAYSELANLLVHLAAKFDLSRSIMESNKIIPHREPGFEWEYPPFSVTLNNKEKRNWNVMFSLIKKLHGDVAQKGAKLSVVIIPSITQVYPELWEDFLRNTSEANATNLNPNIPNKRITEWCKNNNIPVIDLLPGLKDAALSNPYLYYPVNRHWTPDGHAAAADILLSELR